MSEGAINVLGNISGTTINMAGGRIGTAFGPVTGSGGVLNVSGGTVGQFEIADGVRLNLSGGQFDVYPGDAAFLALPGSTVHVRVQNASLNAAAIPGLEPGQTVEINVTNMLGELTGKLSDGAAFKFELAADRMTADFNSPVIRTSPIPGVGQVKVLVTLVPEPTLATLVLTAIAPLLRRRFR